MNDAQIEQQVMKNAAFTKKVKLMKSNCDKMIAFLDKELENPKQVEGLSEAQVIQKLKDGRQKMIDLKETIDNDYDKLKEQFKNTQAGLLFDVGEAMSLFI